MESVLCLFIVANRTFVAKFVDKKYTDVVEFNQILAQQGMQLMGIFIGTLDYIPSSTLTFILDKTSPYYTAYFSTTSNIQSIETNRKILHN